MPLMLMLVAINATSGVRLGSAQQGIATPDASQSSEQCQAKGPVRDIALSPDGRYLLTPWNGANARLWDFKTGAVLHTFSVSQDSNDYVVYVSFSPDGNYALLGTDLGVATLWSVQSGEKVRTFGEAEGLLGQRQIQFSPDGKYILATYTHGAALWDVQSGNEVRSFLADLNLDYTSEFSADGRFLLTQDPPAILWDVQTGQALHTFEYSWAAKISPVGNYVSALTSDGLQI